jgi:Flp pilus assembly protein TadG
MVIHRPSSFLRRLFRDRRGFSAVTVAVSMPVLFGVAGLGIDAGLWYTIKRQNQSAADAAALSAAYEVIAGNTNVATNLTPAASEAATRNNYTGTTPVVTYPYSDAVVASGVQVTLSQTQNAWFSSWFPAFTSFTIANEAVAAVNTLPPACILALNRSAPGTISLAGKSSITAPNCTIVSDSNSDSAFSLQDAADSITAATLITPGEISANKNATITTRYPAQTGANPVPDPYGPSGSAPFTNPCTGTADYLSHSFLTCNMPTTGTCSYNKSTQIWSGAPCVIPGGSINSGDTLPSGIQISGGLSLKGGITNLSPGTYWITDGDLTLGPGGGGTTLTCPTCTNGGAGVTIILTTAKPGTGKVGTVNLDSLANLNLNAPSTGTYKGLVLIQDSNNPPAGTTIDTNNTMKANATETLSGLVYFPGSAVNF